MKISNGDWWAIGFVCQRGFNIRRMVQGRALARQEKREGERIVRVMVFHHKTQLLLLEE